MAISIDDGALTGYFLCWGPAGPRSCKVRSHCRAVAGPFRIVRVKSAAQVGCTGCRSALKLLKPPYMATSWRKDKETGSPWLLRRWSSSPFFFLFKKKFIFVRFSASKRPADRCKTSAADRRMLADFLGRPFNGDRCGRRAKKKLRCCILPCRGLWGAPRLLAFFFKEKREARKNVRRVGRCAAETATGRRERERGEKRKKKERW